MRDITLRICILVMSGLNNRMDIRNLESDGSHGFEYI